MDIPGPDGFLLTSDNSLRAAHLRLSDYLLAEEQRVGSATFDVPPFDIAPWRKLPKSEFVDVTQAVLLRLRWLDQHDAELENAHRARIRLRTLLRVLYTIKVPYSEPVLRAVLDCTTPLLGLIAPYGPVDRVL